jgi:hypothetical protein
MVPDKWRIEVKRLLTTAAMLAGLTGSACAGEYFKPPPVEIEKVVQIVVAMPEQDRAGFLVLLDAYKTYCRSTAPAVADKMAVLIKTKAMPSNSSLEQVSKEVADEISERGIGPWCREGTEVFKRYEE